MKRPFTPMLAAGMSLGLAASANTAKIMSRNLIPALPAAALLACLALAAQAAGQPPDAQPAQKESMRVDQPMTTGMMKKGMKQGDVKRKATKQAKKMQPAMEREEKSMPQDRTAP